MLGEMILGLMWLARALSNIEGKSAVLLQYCLRFKGSCAAGLPGAPVASAGGR